MKRLSLASIFFLTLGLACSTNRNPANVDNTDSGNNGPKFVSLDNFYQITEFRFKEAQWVSMPSGCYTEAAKKGWNGVVTYSYTPEDCFAVVLTEVSLTGALKKSGRPLEKVMELKSIPRLALLGIPKKGGDPANPSRVDKLLDWLKTYSATVDHSAINLVLGEEANIDEALVRLVDLRIVAQRSNNPLEQIVSLDEALEATNKFDQTLDQTNDQKAENRNQLEKSSLELQLEGLVRFPIRDSRDLKLRAYKVKGSGIRFGGNIGGSTNLSSRIYLSSQPKDQKSGPRHRSGFPGMHFDFAKEELAPGW
jgi:hypothetical protein